MARWREKAAAVLSAAPAHAAEPAPPDPPTVATVATVTVATHAKVGNLERLNLPDVDIQPAPPQAASIEMVATPDQGQPPDPDRFAWPHGPAMNAAEVRRMVARLRTFEAQGMPLAEAEAEADRLMHMERTRSNAGTLSAVSPPATPATPPAPPKRHPYPTSELDRLYMRHHFACRVCQAVGRGIGTRCAVGLTYHLVAASRMPMD